MSQRLKLIIAYDGATFAGWQSQAHRNTIQDKLEHALHKISGVDIRAHGAGRTDAGVHALGQSAHLDLSDRRMSSARWRDALNAILPNTIRVLQSRVVSKSFHARFSAKAKTYRYRIWAAPILPPFEVDRAWHISAPLDVDLLKATAKKFVGRHDFRAFAANRGKKEEDTMRTIQSLIVRKRGPEIKIEIKGDGFLYKMARLMVGAMVRVALQQMAMTEIDARLKSAGRETARFTAPATGLYLMRVWY